MTKPSLARRLTLTIFLLGSLVGFAVASRADLSPRDDAEQYLTIATHLADEGRFALDEGPTHFREPGYPTFVAAIFALSGGSRLAVLGVQALLLGVVAAGAFRLARRALPDAWALIVGLAVIACLAAYVGLFLAELLAAALALGAIFALDATDRRRDARAAAIAGTALGALALTKAIALFFVPLAALLLYIRGRTEPKRQIMRVALFCLVAAVLVAPWMLRNARLTGRPQIASRGGLVLWVRASRTEFSAHDRHLLMAQALFGDRLTAKVAPDVIGKRQALDGSEAMSKRYIAWRADGLTDAEVDAKFGQEAVGTILQHPIRYGIDAVQVFFMLNMIAVPVVDMRAFLATGHEALPALAKDAVVIALRLANITWIFLLASGLWAARKIPALTWPAALVVFWNLIYMAVDAIPRYAAPILPLTLTLATVAAHRIVRRITSKA